MSFLSSIFLVAGASLAIPILIALWNRRRFRREVFGGYYLLKNILETTHRRLRILEILKLLNRLALFTILILIFADPYRWDRKLSDAGKGFALIIDVGRSLQVFDADGRVLALQASGRAMQLLKQMPDEAQGAVFFVSDRCDSGSFFETRRLTARASEWMEAWNLKKIPFVGSATTPQGLSQCLQKVRGLFGEDRILTAFISPMPSTLDPKFLESSGLRLEPLMAPKMPVEKALDVQQELLGDRLRLRFAPPVTRRASLIRLDRVEELGEVTESTDLLAADSAWLWVHSDLSATPGADLWSSSKIIPLSNASVMRVSLWAERESPGYLSLLTALRNYPGLKVTRQVGGEPSGDAVIVYGAFKWDPSIVKRAWFFVSYDHPSGFSVRDQKQWLAGLELSDARKAFQMETQDGRVFVKKYLLLDLDRFETMETFEDGAPSLLKDRGSRDRHWISPFDLEDLTTDLSLEPTFIPYLYRRLERWLALDQSQQSGEWKDLWTMPGAVPPTSEVLARQAWPGIYGDSKISSTFKITEPAKLPEKFLEVHHSATESEWRDEKVFFKPLLLKALGASLMLELLLCLASVRWAWIGMWLLAGLLATHRVEAANITRPIQIGILSSMDPDRKTALQQLLLDFEHMSNLDFDKPDETTPKNFWAHSVIVVSSVHSFGPFKKEERELVRDYCERGGLIIFDDPIAAADSDFYRSVRKELGEIFPGRELSSVAKEDVLFRTFYLLSEVSGRKLSSPNLEGLMIDKRWVVVFSFNDLLGANLKSARGDFAFSVTPYGISQRILAKRMWLNLMMYSVALDYKDDAIHLPHILKKRAR